MINPNQLGRRMFPASASQWMLVGLRGSVAATGYSLNGPEAGEVSIASTPFTVALTGGTTVPLPVTVTPSDSGGGGSFTPATVILDTGSTSANFTYTPGSAGAKIISVTNNRGLPNPGNIGYLASAGVHLLNTLISYWKLDEASGTRNDSQGTNHLTDNNTVTSAAGKVGNAAVFVTANLEYLSCASNSTLQMSGNTDWSFSFWVNFSSLVDQIIISKDSNVAASRDFTIDYLSGGGNGIRVYIQGGATYMAKTGLTGTTGVWYFIVAWYDSSNGQLHLRFNDTTTLDAAVTGATGTDVSAAQFRIGARQYVGFEGYASAMIDEVGLWKRKLTVPEITALYNGGSGLPFSSFTA